MNTAKLRGRIKCLVIQNKNIHKYNLLVFIVVDLLLKQDLVGTLKFNAHEYFSHTIDKIKCKYDVPFLKYAQITDKAFLSFKVLFNETINVNF